MNNFLSANCILILDSVACALFAGAAACRARNAGAHLAGCVTLGCLCGLSGSLIRELILHGQAGAGAVINALPDDALVGACAALILLKFKPLKGYSLFWWLDTLSISLACMLGVILSLPIEGIVGCLVIGLLNGLLAGFIRDVSLGDIAMFIDQNWYAAAAAIGCVICLCVLMLPLIIPLPVFWSDYAPVLAGSSGAAIIVILRFWKGRDLP